jgi:hypothetical protein
MKKKNFISMLMGTVGGILFSIGMCMSLLPDWNAFTPGIVVAVIGIIVLFAMMVVRRKMEGKPLVELSGKTIGTIFLGIIGTLALGIGLTMTMIWEGLLIQGIVVGIVGILLLMCLIPICKGLE